MKNAAIGVMAGREMRADGVNTLRSWSTASFGGPAESSLLELSALGDHLGLCKSSHGHLFALHCAAEAMHGFMVSRFVTTLVVIALLAGITNLVL